MDTDKPGPLPVGSGIAYPPLVGKVVQMSIMARFAAIFSILQRSGVSILDSLDILSETINNAALEREFSAIKEKLRSAKASRNRSAAPAISRRWPSI